MLAARLTGVGVSTFGSVKLKEIVQSVCWLATGTASRARAAVSSRFSVP